MLSRIIFSFSNCFVHSHSFSNPGDFCPIKIHENRVLRSLYGIYKVRCRDVFFFFFLNFSFRFSRDKIVMLHVSRAFIPCDIIGRNKLR